MSQGEHRQFSRRDVLKGAAAGLGLAVAGNWLAACTPGQPASAPATDDLSELVVGHYPGAGSKAIAKYILPDLQAKYPNAKIIIKEGAAGDREAQLRANPNNPELDIVYIGNEQPAKLVADGLIDPPDPNTIKEYGDLYPIGKGDAYGTYLLEIGIGYNPEKVKTPPTSWLDLWKPEFKGKVTLQDLRSSPGQAFWWAVAQAIGADPKKDMEPVYKKLLELKPNVVSYATGASQVLKVMEQGDAWITVGIGGYYYEAQDRGQPVDFARPKEGPMATLNFAAITRNSKHKTLARDWIRLALQEKAQTGIAEELYWGPTNAKVRLSEKAAKRQPYGEEGVKKLVMPDYVWIGDQMPKWLDWFQKNMKI